MWRAIASAEEFGTWFRMAIDGEFVEGVAVYGRVLHPGYEHIRVDMQVERVQPERYFAWRLHHRPRARGRRQGGYDARRMAASTWPLTSIGRNMSPGYR